MIGSHIVCLIPESIPIRKFMCSFVSKEPPAFDLGEIMLQLFVCLNRVFQRENLGFCLDRVFQLENLFVRCLKIKREN